MFPLKSLNITGASSAALDRTIVAPILMSPILMSPILMSPILMSPTLIWCCQEKKILPKNFNANYNIINCKTFN